MSRKLGIFALAIATIVVASPSGAPAQAPAGTSQIDAFYERYNAPLWFPSGVSTPGANAPPSILRRAQLDGLADGPALAQQVEQADCPPSAPIRPLRCRWTASSLLSGFATCGFSNVGCPASNMPTTGRPERESVADILSRAAQPGQLQLILKIASVNPMYDGLRNALWNEIYISSRARRPPSSPISPVFASLRRTANMWSSIGVAARLYMLDEHGIADSMRVIVGKPDTPTPLLVERYLLCNGKSLLECP